MAFTACGRSSKLSRSASSIAADIAIGHHILRIDDYSLTKVKPTGEYLESHPFTVGGHRWQIRYYPNGSKSEHADFISIYLQQDGNVADLVNARYKFRLVDDDANEEPKTLDPVTSFASNLGWGCRKFIKREDLEKSNRLKDDSLFVRCDIVVVNEFRAKDETAVESPPRFASGPPSDLHLDLGDLLRSEKGADVVFDVGGQTFAAHRCVLAARSSVFRAELFGTMKEGNSNTPGIVRIEDMEAQVFKAFLYFVYTDSLPESEEAEEELEEAEAEEDDIMAQHLLVAADRYNLERLKLICEDKLCGYIDVRTVATILTLAAQHNCHRLKKACFDFLSDHANLRTATATDDFKHLSRSCPDILVELIGMLAT